MMFVSNDKGSLPGYKTDGKDLAEGNLSTERREIYSAAANKQSHRNVGLLRGPGCQSLTPVLAK